jgi:hypothetical protein
VIEAAPGSAIQMSSDTPISPGYLLPLGETVGPADVSYCEASSVAHNHVRQTTPVVGRSPDVWVQPTTGPTAYCVGSKPCLRRWSQEDGSDLGGSCHWTPTGWTCQWAVVPVGGSLNKAPSHRIRGSFYWTPMCQHTCGWSAIAIRSSFHRPLSHLTCPCLFVFSISQVSRDRRQPPPAVIGPFLAGSGGGVYLCQSPRDLS